MVFGFKNSFFIPCLTAAAITLCGDFSFASCQPVLKQQVKIQKQRHGADPGTVVEKATSTLHDQFRPVKGKNANFIYVDSTKIQEQMSALYNYFALSTWLDRINLIPKIKKLSPLKRSEIHYLFTHWVRVRYMTAMFRLVRKRELEEVYRAQDRFPANIRKATINNPSKMVITGYSSHTCKDQTENLVYDCSKKLVWVHTHQSPEVLCSIRKFSRNARFKFLVQLEKDDFKIVDVEYEGRKVYKDSFIELNEFFDRKNITAIENDLKLWSFLNASKADPKAVEKFSQSISKEDRRLPASTH